jgi:hypothetical protein
VRTIRSHFYTNFLTFINRHRLKVDIANQGTHTTDTQMATIQRLRNSLQWKINAWKQFQVLYTPAVQFLEAAIQSPPRCGTFPIPEVVLVYRSNTDNHFRTHRLMSDLNIDRPIIFHDIRTRLRPYRIRFRRMPLEDVRSYAFCIASIKIILVPCPSLLVH